MPVGGLRSPRVARVLPAILVALLAVALLARPAVTAAAAEPHGKSAPELNAATWLLLDPTDGEELAAHGPDRERAIASTTKLMTAYLALRKLRMDEKLEVPAYSAGAAESVAGLNKGERLTVHDLIVAMMLPSANDAAETIADGISGSEQAFVALMNRTAADLGLDHTHYANPIGLDANGNYSTAADLTDLAIQLLSDKRFRKIVGKPQATLKSGAEQRVVTNTNTLLLSDPSVDGVKTGHTLDAGYVLVASAKRDTRAADRRGPRRSQRGRSGRRCRGSARLRLLPLQAPECGSQGRGSGDRDRPLRGRGPAAARQAGDRGRDPAGSGSARRRRRAEAGRGPDRGGGSTRPGDGHPGREVRRADSAGGGS